MGAVGNLVRDIAAMFGVQMTPTVMAVLVFGLFVLSLPMLKANHSTRMARKRVNEAARERGEARQRLAAEALTLVATNPVGQIVVAEEAHKLGLQDTAAAALKALTASGKRRDDVRRLKMLIHPEPPRFAEAEAAAILRRWESGLHDAARAQLTEALARWPNHPAFDDVRGLVTAPVEAPGSQVEAAP
ncbi:hypothetical protein L6R49_11760 [Myxococcota bacterium]|nr:hypothetical protein [Myxococcota bacterium]